MSETPERSVASTVPTASRRARWTRTRRRAAAYNANIDYLRGLRSLRDG